MLQRLNAFCQDHLAWVMIGAVLLGLFPPYFHPNFFLLLEPLLMLLLLLVFMKIDLLEVLKGLKDFKLMGLVCVTNLLITPVLLYGISTVFLPELALAILLLSALPSGTASPALADLLKGNTSLAMSVAILTSLLAPFTLPLLFELLTGQTVVIDVWGMFSTLIRVVLVPMLLSQFAKRWFSKQISDYQDSFGLVTILVVVCIVWFSLADQRALVLSEPLLLLQQLAVLYGVFAILHLFGYLTAWQRSHPDRIALTVTRAYMNNGIGIVLAAAYFPPQVLIFLVLSEIPWSTCLAPFRRLLKQLEPDGIKTKA